MNISTFVVIYALKQKTKTINIIWIAVYQELHAIERLCKLQIQQKNKLMQEILSDPIKKEKCKVFKFELTRQFICLVP